MEKWSEFLKVDFQPSAGRSHLKSPNLPLCNNLSSLLENLPFLAQRPRQAIQKRRNYPGLCPLLHPWQSISFTFQNPPHIPCLSIQLPITQTLSQPSFHFSASWIPWLEQHEDMLIPSSDSSTEKSEFRTETQRGALDQSQDCKSKIKTVIQRASWRIRSQPVS